MPLLDNIFLEDQIKIVASFLQPVNIFPHKYLNIFLGSPGLHCYAITNIFQVNFNKQYFRQKLKVKVQKTHKKSWGILFRMSEQSRIFFYIYICFPKKTTAGKYQLEGATILNELHQRKVFKGMLVWYLIASQFI